MYPADICDIVTRRRSAILPVTTAVNRSTARANSLSFLRNSFNALLQENAGDNVGTALKRNAILLAIKVVQECVNHSGNSWFNDDQYYGNFDHALFNTLVDASNVYLEHLENVCRHENAPLGNFKFSLFGTNYTGTADKLRQFVRGAQIADARNTVPAARSGFTRGAKSLSAQQTRLLNANYSCLSDDDGNETNSQSFDEHEKLIPPRWSSSFNRQEHNDMPDMPSALQQKSSIFSKWRSFSFFSDAVPWGLRRDLSENESNFLCQSLNLTPGTQIPPMSDKELKLARDMINAFNNKKELTSDEENTPALSRTDITRKFADKLNKLYRPGGQKEMVWNTRCNFHKAEKQLLSGILNGGEDHFDPSTMFRSVAYTTTRNGEVEFGMVHPVIGVLLTLHIPPIHNEMMQHERVWDIHVITLQGQFTQAVNDFNQYQRNKEDVDSLLTTIYHEHDESLLIGTYNEENKFFCRNYIQTS